MSDTDRLSIIIRAYNEEAHIEKLLLGIGAQLRQPHEIILVDSGSSDRTVAIAQRYGVKIVHIAKPDFTFGRALNLGCAAATGEILVFVSAHVYPTHKTWLGNLVAPFADPRVQLTYGRQRGGAVNKFSEHQIFSRWFPNEPALPQRGYFCNNANCAIRRTSWEEQRYDEALTGLEDLDWGKRMQHGGGWIGYVPTANIVHVHDENWGQVQNRYRREALALRRIDEYSKFDVLDFLQLLCINVVSDCRAARREGVLRKEFTSIWRFRLHQLLGTWQGHTGPCEISEALRRRFYFPVDSSAVLELDAADEGQIDYESLPSFGSAGLQHLKVVATTRSSDEAPRHKASRSS